MQSSLLPGKNRRDELPHRSSTAAREIQIKQNYGRWRQQALFQVLILRYDIHYNSHKYLVKCRETYSGDYLLHQQFTGTASIFFFSFPNFKIFPTKKA
jgi:hypothetical protein